MKVFLISGKAEHGKDTLADCIIDLLGDKAVKLPLASMVKFVAQLAGWDGKKDKKGREVLQYIGTERTREECNYPNYWECRVIEMIEILSYKYEYFIIPDCRFQSEVNTLISRFEEDAIDIRIVRPNHTSMLTKEQLEHRSEIELDAYVFNYYVNNSCGTDWVRQQAKMILEKEGVCV